jgi:hypothetical protein
MVEKIVCAEEKSTGDEPQSNLLREVSELKKKIARISAIPGSITYQSPRTDSSDDPAWEIVRFVLSTEYMNIPPEVLDYAKRLNIGHDRSLNRWVSYGVHTRVS